MRIQRFEVYVLVPEDKQPRNLDGVSFSVSDPKMEVLLQNPLESEVVTKKEIRTMRADDDPASLIDEKFNS